MKKIGIITMHRVQNSGSILQTYALYMKLKKLGHDCEIIDYQYPNSYHSNDKVTYKTIRERVFFFLLRIRFFLLYKNSIQKKRFSSFMKNYLRLSRYYPSKEEIFTNPPVYDIYMIGSDQVWNPNCMKGDPTFFCGFALNKYKVSYASSFSTSYISLDYRNHYKSLLEDISYIGVRERLSVQIVKEIANKESIVVCDPTLLLTKDDYLDLTKGSQIRIKEPYILVYALSYAYNPYPQITNVIDYVKRKVKLKVIYLHANNVEHYHFGKSITSAGPCEFIDLFMNAGFVITSSFHGTAFALNFEKPFFSIVPQDVKHDSRIVSLLKDVGAIDRAVYMEQNLEGLNTNMDYSKIRIKLKSYRSSSIEYLKMITK